MGNQYSKLPKPGNELPEIRKGPLSLFNLSDDVLLRIYNFLGPVDHVSFTLSSRRLYAIVSKPGEKFTAQGDDRLEILQRLERDGVYPMSILCVLCKGFHRPRLVNEWNAEEATRACVLSGDSEMYGKTMCETFPTYVHFDLVAAITRSWRHNLGLYSPQLLEFSVTFSNPKVKGSVTCRTEAKVINGSLILKTERVLFAGYKRVEALKGLPDLVQLLEKENDLGWCCLHVQWREIYPFVFESDKTDPNGFLKHHCLWSHDSTCSRRRRPRPGICNGETNRRLGFWQCRNCHTDVSMSYTYIEPDDVKLVTLTTWKDLGRGISIEDPVWKSHNTAADLTPREPGLEALDLYHLFEGEGGKKAPFPYQPQLGREVLLDLCNLLFRLTTTLCS